MHYHCKTSSKSPDVNKIFPTNFQEHAQCTITSIVKLKLFTFNNGEYFQLSCSFWNLKCASIFKLISVNKDISYCVQNTEIVHNCKILSLVIVQQLEKLTTLPWSVTLSLHTYICLFHVPKGLFSEICNKQHLLISFMIVKIIQESKFQLLLLFDF